ncbi:MAG: acyl CoA:acetate/3-ketoacid CoA transferase [Geminicoccaceae bacterium]
MTTADGVAASVPDGITIALTGSGGGLIEADAIHAALERRFLATGHPRGLTLIHALGQGDAKARGLNRFAYEGMVARVIGGHWTWSPRMQALAEADAIEAYTLPAGAIMLLLREIGAGRPGLITHVGLGTFADPRHGGGACNRRALAADQPRTELITVGGRELLRYLPLPIDLAIVRGSLADPAGNLSLVHEAADLDVVAAALAAHNSGGRVVAQAGRIVARGTLPARQVTLPGVLVDALVEAADQPQTYLGAYDPAISGEVGGRPDFRPAAEPPAFGVRAIIARRAADEARPGASVNFGFGIPGAIPGILAERGTLDALWITVEQGIHNGELLDGEMFGAARYPEAIVSSTRQFDFYSGGGIDMAFLGMGELDAAGNVNVSRLGSKVVGPGGFVDIAQNAKRLVFCGTFDAKGTDYAWTDGKLTIRRHGEVAKLVPTVREITFSADYARAVGQEVLYVTERAVFRLGDQGVELIEVAPGVELGRDVLERMQFAPAVSGQLAEMPARHFIP